MDETKKLRLTWGIRILLAAFFLFSAYAKIYPSANMALGTFEMKQLVPMGMSEGFAAYFSRFIIAAEFSIGLGLLQPHFLKRFVIPAAAFMLLLFTIQLSYDWATAGIKDDCGCFGDLMPLNTWESIVKNIIALGLFAFLWKLLPSDNKEHNNFAYPALIFTTVAMLMYAGAPIQRSSVQPTAPTTHSAEVHPDFMDSNEDTTATVVDTVGVANNDTKDPNESNAGNETPKEETKPKGPTPTRSKFSDFPAYIPPAIKVDEGKKIICMFAAGCEHCQATIKALTEMRNEVKMPPIHIVFMDEETEKIPEFFKIAGREYSYSVATVTDFWKILDFSRDTPGVCYLWNGNIMYFADGINENEFKKADLKKALAKEK